MTTGRPTKAERPDGLRKFTDLAPLFVVGAPRSGTSLLRRLLDRHSELAIAGELHFFDLQIKFADRVPDLTSDAAIEQAVDFISSLTSMRLLPYGDEILRDAATRLKACPTRTYELLFRFQLESYARMHGKKRVGEKTPQYVRHLEELFATFPRAKVIHIYRDPRDVVSSVVQVPWASPDVVTNSLKWRAEMRLLSEWRADPRLIELQYERLVLEPEGPIRKLCAAIGVEYEPAMLRASRSDEVYDTDSSYWKRRVREEVSATSVGSWPARIGMTRGHVVQRLCAPEMARLGYEMIPPGLTSRLLMPVAILGEIVRWTAYKLRRSSMAGNERVGSDGSMADAIRLVFRAIRNRNGVDRDE